MRKKAKPSMEGSPVVVILIDMQLSFVDNLDSEERSSLVAKQLEILEECVRFDIPLVVLEFYEHGTTIPELNEIIS